MSFQEHRSGTWLQGEAAAYPNGGQTRKGVAMWPDGKLRRVWAGIPDTFSTIPAHGQAHGRYFSGHLMLARDGTLDFWPHVKHGGLHGDGTRVTDADACAKVIRDWLTGRGDRFKFVRARYEQDLGRVEVVVGGWAQWSWTNEHALDMLAAEHGFVCRFAGGY